MYQFNIRRPSLRSALLLGAASAAAVSLSAPAFAQQQQAVETVIVTGSRIPQQGLYASSPVTAVGQQELKFEGTTNVENLLNNLPEAFADMGETASNGASGTASVDLRGLGASRTLVLIDGKRLMPGDPLDPVPDLNNIPAALVDHVEVLTGGASAVYGSDAEAGVVNFIMRKDFEGIELDGQYGINQAGNNSAFFQGLQSAHGFPPAPTDWWGGPTADATLIMGANTADNKGNVTAYVSYRNIQPVLEGSRDFSACSISAAQSGGPGTAYDSHVCAGSSNFNRWISIDDYSAGKAYDFFQTGTGKAGSGAFVPYTGTPAQQFNYGPLNYLQRPDERYTGGFFAHYDISKAIQPYASFMFMDDHTVSQIAPSGLFLGAGQLSGYDEVNCSNPLMTAQERTTLCGADGTGAGNIVPGQSRLEIGRRALESGNRLGDLRHTSYRVVVGVKGDLGSGWSYDVSGQYGLTAAASVNLNDYSKQRVQNALEVDPATGKCFAAEPDANGVVNDPNCVPLDIFNGIGSISPAAQQYVLLNTFLTGFNREEVVTGNVTGDLGEWGIQSPWAQSPVAVSFGSEYREETTELNVDHGAQIGDGMGAGGPTLPVPEAGFDVAEGFGEVSIPIIQGVPFFEDLSANAAYRYSDYSTAGNVSSYKYGFEWQTIDSFKLRGSYERAVRAPNVLEIFAPASGGLFGGQDPCSGAAGPDATETANCRAHGVTNVGSGLLNCPASQCNGIFGGNVNLKPESSDTWTIGGVFTPTFLDGFTLTVDYFDIKVHNFIASVNPTLILEGCYGDAANAVSQAATCGLINRNAAGQIFGSGNVTSTDINTGFLKTNGIDIEANYQTDLADLGLPGGWGSLAANFLGTYLNSLETDTVAGLSSFDCAGLFGTTCGVPNPKWRHKMRLTWSTPWDIDLSLAWRHYSGVNLDQNTSNPVLAGTFDEIDGHIPEYNYFDLAANWTIQPGIEVRAGVNNLFDKTPPVLDSNVFAISAPAFGNGNTYPNMYDSLGRTIYVGTTLKY